MLAEQTSCLSKVQERWYVCLEKKGATEQKRLFLQCCSVTWLHQRLKTLQASKQTNYVIGQWFQMFPPWKTTTTIMFLGKLLLPEKFRNFIWQETNHHSVSRQRNWGCSYSPNEWCPVISDRETASPHCVTEDENLVKSNHFTTKNYNYCWIKSMQKPQYTPLLQIKRVATSVC